MCSFNLSFVLFALVCVSTSATYQVYRDVKDFGAKGDGVTDDTEAIILALTQDRGDAPGSVYPNAKYSSSTKTPAYVYFPAGTYKVTATLPVVYYTQMIGEYPNRPTIKFVSDSTVSVRVLEVAGRWYTGVNQNNFYRQVRNFVLDMTECRKCTGVHWQVAQATMMNNVMFNMGIGTENQGIWMENGSGGMISDLVFHGGLFGMWVGNQQFTSRNITITHASVAAIYLNWDWVWSFTSLTIAHTPVGIDLGQATGSAVVLDSTFTNCSTAALRTGFTAAARPTLNNLVLGNVRLDVAGGSPVLLANQDDSPLVAAAGQDSLQVESFVQGHIWGASASGSGSNTVAAAALSPPPARPSSLTTTGGVKFFGRAQPHFVATDTVDVTTLGLVGDGATDNTAALQSALYAHAGGKVLWFPHGTYLITDTVYVPPGSRMQGQVWSVLMAATGPSGAFSDSSAPKPMLRVGKPGEVGVAQLNNFMLSTQGPQPGAVMIEWNVHDRPGRQGECGMWDVHWRIGGAIGTRIRPDNCPKGNGVGAPAKECAGAFMLLHVTRSSSLYMENCWGWTADHDIDVATQLNVYNGRGMLVESQGPVWMYGTAMEHSYQYQFNIVGARDVFASILQTETPYFQPSAYTPFTASGGDGGRDPAYCTGDPRCAMALAMAVRDSQDIFNYGTGFYSFFNTWNQTCLKSKPPRCQLDLVTIANSTAYTFGLNTYGSSYGTNQGDPYSSAAANQNTFCATGIVNQNTFGK